MRDNTFFKQFSNTTTDTYRGNREHNRVNKKISDDHHENQISLEYTRYTA